MKLALNYEDVCLVPKYNNISSRKDPTIKLETRLTRGMEMDIPIVAANMDSVISTKLAHVMVENGSVPIFHRFCSKEKQLEWIEEFPDCFLSIGVKREDVKWIIKNYNGFFGVVIDIAHGHSDKMLETIGRLREYFGPAIQIIAGNICTARAVHDLHLAGVDAVKVGIGPGAACKTRAVAGVGSPQFSAIQECAKEASYYQLPVIADGGIKSSRDVVLALAAGASSVMIGKMFALTYESGAEKKVSDNYIGLNVLPSEAKYRGQSSADFQKEFFGEVKKDTVPEGEAQWGKITGSAQSVLDQLLGGLRSGLTYCGARNLEELQRKAEFIQVTPSYSHSI